MDAMKLMEKIASTYQAVLGNNLVGVYLHGSLAMGCFREQLSDIDFLVVVEHEPTQFEKEAMISTLLALCPDAPEKGFEMSVIVRSCLDPFQYPTPFVLHFSKRHLENAKRDITAYCETMRGTDVDLAAHCMVTRAQGKALCGQPIDAVFGQVPRADYLDSIGLDIESAQDDVEDEPTYVLLNLCRVLGYLRTDRVMSKAQGGEWAADNLTGDAQEIAKQALNAYTSGAEITVPLPKLKAFCRDMLALIEREKGG